MFTRHRDFFAYTRVSTAKQGLGVSLAEQRAAIESYAERNGLRIVRWFEEKETAAKRGRALFGQMLTDLRCGRAKGVIIHKIDRSARNLRDWADLGELVDSGCEVHFATESLDLNSRGGRLSADIQAVVAADYIRNLREETRKGFYGRLKQGFYPLPAPLGYLDRGKAKAKTFDPVRAPFVRDAFELYASARFSLRMLHEEMHRRGLRNRRGGKLSLNGLSRILNNPFYTGVVRIRRTGEVFTGGHEPLISPSTFRQVQAVLRGKINTKAILHDHLYRRLIRCESCKRHLVGERQKGWIYYRCHSRGCEGICFRQERVASQIRAHFEKVYLSDSETDELRRLIDDWRTENATATMEQNRAIDMQLEGITQRVSRLTEAYIDGAIDRSMFEQKKELLLMSKKELEIRRSRPMVDRDVVAAQMHEIVELIKSLWLSYERGNTDEKRQILKNTTSNLGAYPKNIVIELRSPYRELSKLPCVPPGDPHRGIRRTRAKPIWRLLAKQCNVENQERQREDLLLAA